MVGSDHDLEASPAQQKYASMERHSLPSTAAGSEEEPVEAEFLLSRDESRRYAALQLAADTIGVKDNDNASPIAEQFVAAAKVYEGYLKEGK